MRVIPVLVGGATMPAEAELPPSIAALAVRNAVELQDRRWREDVDALVDVLEGRGRSVPGNLPAQPTPFLGRERELGELTELLRRQEVRVLTLTGPGGSARPAWPSRSPPSSPRPTPAAPGSSGWRRCGTRS